MARNCDSCDITENQAPLIQAYDLGFGWLCERCHAVWTNTCAACCDAPALSDSDYCAACLSHLGEDR